MLLVEAYPKASFWGRRGTVSGGGTGAISISEGGDILKTTPLGREELPYHINQKFKTHTSFYRCQTKFGIQRHDGIAVYPCQVLIAENKDNKKRYLYDIVKIGKPTLTANLLDKEGGAPAEHALNSHARVTPTGESAFGDNIAPREQFSITSVAVNQVADENRGTRFSISDAVKAKERVDDLLEGRISRKDGAKIDYRIQGESMETISRDARRIIEEFSRKRIPLSTGKELYFAPDRRTIDAYGGDMAAASVEKHIPVIDQEHRQ
ncbi:MAG: hypothetical protein ACI4SG_08680 [Oligosphaeraceae bacterium]